MQGLCRRPSIGFTGSALHLLRSSLARREAPLLAAAQRFMHYFPMRNEKEPTEHYKRTIGFKPSNLMEEMRRGMKSSVESGAIEEVIGSNHPTADEDILHTTILRNSCHRDGTIYKTRDYWKRNYLVDITDRNETWVEPMRFSVVTTNCFPDPGKNREYYMPCEMVQIFSLKLAKAPINSGAIQLYGYIAARDFVDSKLNYVFNRSRDDPIIVHQGSRIEMTGPKRGIVLFEDVLFEFDMRIKNGEQEEDLQLIDGITELHEEILPWEPSTVRINGDSGGAVDMTLANMYHGVEATIEVVILEVENSFDLSLACHVFMEEASEEFQLFGGAIGEACGLRRFIVAVSTGTVMHLKFKFEKKGPSPNVVEHCCSFEAKLHGFAGHQIQLEAATISLKVTWSASALISRSDEAVQIKFDPRD